MENLEIRLFDVMATILNVDRSRLAHDSTPESVPEWDSLNHMNLIFAVEEEFGIQLDDNEILSSMSVEGLVGILKRK